jgi:hypothetical protein
MKDSLLYAIDDADHVECVECHPPWYEWVLAAPLKIVLPTKVDWMEVW